MFEKDGRSRIFSRDCLEIKIKLAENDFLWAFINHFKSQGYGPQSANDAKRLRQATRVAGIINEKKLDLKKDKVLVLGDFNASADSASIAPLINMDGLKDVLSLKIQNPGDRWTYQYNNKKQQIDFMLVSEPLQNACTGVGIERRGMYDVAKFSGGAITAWPEVQDNGITASASDHGAIWATFDL
jgi:endonuclease/exonuclease/phosphatase family metal-dependent hydrolase